PASNRRVEGELNLSPVLPRFEPYPDYRFQIGEVVKEPYHETLAPTITDDKGNTELNLDLKRFAGRAYRLNVLARAFEAEGGRSVAAQNTAIVADAPYLVGVKPDGDLSFVSRSTERHAHWLAVNQQLTPVAAPQLTLEWVERKYLSVLTQQPDSTYKYVSRLKETVRNTRNVQIPAGGSNFAIPTQEPGDFMLVLRNSAGAELNRLSYSVAGEANISRSLDRNAELQIQLDKSAYSGRDTISVSIRAPYAGAGLITIERERVFFHQWFRTSTTSSVQHVTLPPGFEGNGYVAVEFLRDPASDEIFMSPLSYGVAPFAADLSVRTQQVRVSAVPQIKPGAILTMHVAPAEASRVAVFAVDEGILQVARYKNPDPLAYFFQKRMLQVETTQILDLMLPEFERFLALAAPGGDADGGFARHLNPFNRKRKPPVAWWSGIIDAGPEGRDLRYTVPDYFNGRLRIIAVAVSPRRAGVTEADTEVKGDFILTPNVPAMVAPGDEFSVTVGVFNNTRGKDPIRVQAHVSRELTLTSSASSDLEIAEKREGVAEFQFKANAVLGPASLKFSATRGRSEAHIEESVSVRPAIAYRTQLTLGSFDSASTNVPLKRDLYSELRSVEASVSALPLVWGEGLIAYLDSYPYPCTEQLVSKGFAALLLASRPEFGAVKTRDPQPIAGTLSMLQSRENDSGGFGLWSSSPQSAEFPTVYAAHFLLEARDRGQKVPPEMLASVDEWLTRFASTPAPTLEDGRLRAYAVYLLARQGIKPAAALSNVEQELANRQAATWFNDLAAAYLASTYRLMQRNAEADRIIRNVPWSQQKRGGMDDVYYDPVVHDAQLLYLLARHFPDRINRVPSEALEGIGSAISGNRVSSLSAAYTLLALDAYAKAAAPAVKLGIVLGGQRQASTSKVSVPVGIAKVQFTREGSLTAYYSLNESGFDRNPPTSEISQGLEVIHEFLDANSNVTTKVTVGQEFWVRLRVRTTSRDRLNQIAVVDLLPGGVEPTLDRQLGPGTDWAPTYVDKRDDRVVFYGDATKNAATYVYKVRATNAGVFQAPPAFAEGMYNRQITGQSQAAKLEIVKP
ncbi:MAG: alpha-2-macroglobulin family protein, partial [Terriglobia bacterium]